MHSDVLPLTEVDDYADTILAQQISQIPGVGQVSIGGEQKPAVRVQVDPAKLAALGLALEDVRGVLANATDERRPRAASTAATRSFTIYDNDQLLKAAPTRTTSSSPTATARRCACATSARPSTAPRTPSWRPGRTASRGVLLIVFKQPGANVIETVDRIKAALPQLQAAIPPAVKVTVMSTGPRPSAPRSRTSSSPCR